MTGPIPGGSIGRGTGESFFNERCVLDLCLVKTPRCANAFRINGFPTSRNAWLKLM